MQGMEVPQQGGPFNNGLLLTDTYYTNAATHRCCWQSFASSTQASTFLIQSPNMA